LTSPPAVRIIKEALSSVLCLAAPLPAE